MNYTKEWKVGQLRNNYVVYRQDGAELWDRTRIADCYNDEANAHLIAAAPEMYEALKAIVTEPNFGLPGKLYVKARGAIAKVEGGS